MENQDTLLVTGASGKLGEQVLETLLAQGAKRIIATTRAPEKLDRFASQGVKVRMADFNQPDGLAKAFQGATRMLLISTLDIGSRVPQHKAAIDAAKSAGVKHILYTSYARPEGSLALVSPDHLATENLLKTSGLKYTILRNNNYLENLLYTLPGGIKAGALIGCAGEGRVAYITRRDCAKVAAMALLHAERHENTDIVVSGPKSYALADIAGITSSITGKTIASVDMPPEQFKSALVGAGVPESFAAIAVSFDQAIRAGEMAETSDTVMRMTGEAAEDLAMTLKALLG